ncbi:HlyD family type I secretion periplasmic adaptor subunit [Aggregatibacter actinomycetemcomitans]|uniref:Membrane fusion protein (MFP) family protein n=1 Tax=Aggregatibacter actinomycetemcomitans serotype e str. SC1083 TaxID=907488 RepID=G4A937_AGGAC|nr:HlyD family type I secretion periplasmic adaptor subunit [Aggregatibacter actinomycetemcomitans]AEW78092.1 hemolysin D [Aggregatibacter actinomycetemcomitans ANH9381]AMQ92160.1 hemolysin D [Aggregatibacter actinomycetemcomitans]EGY33617.1 HlyD protein [Aggregatibacter actinomycetemcomitans serotype e str. SC1083]KOE52068.1 hemolysin D [Aggregatibacter actinomycetemcomitans serotype b str. S23A]KOE53139.1 hemolysin D [Aggregatibacter actinomycetemcomitans serotype b str. I23C]
MKTWLLALYDVLSRYKNVWNETWKIRKQLDSPIREKDENEFLPAHLELIETPVSNAPRFVSYSIMLFLTLAIIVSIFSNVEIIATASGKFALSGRSKEIKPIENSLVKDIFVKEGEYVKKGELLLKLTALGAEADTLKTKTSLSQAKLEEFRYKSLLEAVEKDQLPILDFSKIDLPFMTENDQKRVTLLIEEQFSTWQKQRHQKTLNLNKKEAEKLSYLARIKKYEGLINTEQVRLDDFRALYKEHAIAKHTVLDEENKYQDAINELEVYKASLMQVENEVLLAKEEQELVTQLFKNDILDKLKQATDNVNLLTFELDKNNQRQQVSEIRAPVSGTVQQLKVHTIDGVVTTAETLMVVVPEEDSLEVTALIQNKDIGFVKEGQDVVIKVEAFPYTRYGYLTGKVKNITLDAIEHPKLGLVFNTIIELDKKTLSTEEKEIPLSAGMEITAEIKTGMRSVISYLLSPLEESIDKSLRER